MRIAPASLGLRLRRTLSDPVRQLQVSVALLLLLIGVGTLWYTLYEGMPWTDALYMTIITMTTVGFNEVHPLSTASRMFTIGLILAGVGVGAWALAKAIGVVLGPALWLSFRKRNMNRSIEQLDAHFIVCGYGRLGRRVVRDLAARGREFIVVDSDRSLEDELLRDGVAYRLGDATRDEVLESARVGAARGLVATLRDDAANAMIALTARELNPALSIVARATEDSACAKLRRAGVDRIVRPESIGGHRLAIALLRPAVHDFFDRLLALDQETDAEIGEVHVGEGSPFIGQPVDACAFPQERRMRVLAVRRESGEVVFNPERSQAVRAGDTLIVVGEPAAIHELEARHPDDVPPPA